MRTYLLLVLVACSIAGCASREVLLPKSADVPSGINFSGRWQLRNDLAEEKQELDTAIRKTDGVRDRVVVYPEDTSQVNPNGTTRRFRGGLVHVFLKTGKRLKITQTPDGIFISFDRAIVDEFRFGENREIKVGPVAALRASGWEGRDYVAETLDQNGMKLTDRYSLTENGNVLRRTIVFRSKNNKTATITQYFDRLN